MSLTCSAMYRDGRVVLPTPSADGHSVEASWNQITEYTLSLCLIKLLTLKTCAVILDRHVIIVIIPRGMIPVNLQKVISG